MLNLLCFLIILLVGVYHQQATVLSTSVREGNSDTDGIKVFTDSVNHWQNLSSNNESTVSSGFTTNGPTKICRSRRCGIPGESLGISGGNSASVEKYPWTVLIQINHTIICGGFLINNNYVVTAASCAFIWDRINFIEPQRWNKSAFTVQLLRYNRSADNDEHINLKVNNVTVHENYSYFNHKNDIALLQLDTEDLDIGLKSKMHSVCLPCAAGENFVGYNGTALGWGLTKKGVCSDVLREVSVSIISNKECRKKIHFLSKEDNMICAEVEKSNKGFCEGGEGSPLLINNNSIYYVIGIASWLNEHQATSVYMRVSSYLDWIAKHTMNASWCSEQSCL